MRETPATRGPIVKYRCYFLTAEGKVGISYLVNALTPHAAAVEVLQRAEGHNFPLLEIWDGSTCVLSLDGSTVQTPSAPPVQARAAADGSGKRRVLVVDDDPSIRLFTAQLLRDEGYYVYETASGAGALELLSRGVVVDALVTDVRMPDMSGFELANHVAGEQPAVKVLYTTGYPVKPGEPRDKMRPGSDILQKPFTSAQLAKAIHGVMKG